MTFRSIFINIFFSMECFFWYVLSACKFIEEFCNGNDSGLDIIEAPFVTLYTSTIQKAMMDPFQ